jgi:2-oxoglutarate dehydrogenase E2 component (dihydrolipoamide succinyltransferase)
MASDIVVPTLGESVTEATVAQWLKKSGDAVARDEALVELETDKVTLEVYAPSDGVLSEVLVEEGESVEVGTILGHVEAGSAPSAKDSDGAKEDAAEPDAKKQDDDKESTPSPESSETGDAGALSPAVRKLIAENNLDPASIKGTGKDGRILKADVEAAIADAASPSAKSASAPSAKSPSAPAEKARPDKGADKGADKDQGHAREERVRMSRLRKRIAERLKEAQNTAAMLSTFNEIDMSAVMKLRHDYRDAFERKHRVRLGFMSFFTRAAVAALKEIPAVNAEIDGDEIVYKNHYDIGMAVGTPQGLVVPVLRDADELSFADIEKTISELGQRARDGKLSMDELTGGTFTITNGGVYGSLMSTPILNPPQSGILGLHKIEERPVAVRGEVKIRPMMYVALSYDHRIIDGREAVTFLVRIKDFIEDPQRLLLEM